MSFANKNPKNPLTREYGVYPPIDSGRPVGIAPRGTDAEDQPDKPRREPVNQRWSFWVPLRTKGGQCDWPGPLCRLPCVPANGPNLNQAAAPRRAHPHTAYAIGTLLPRTVYKRADGVVIKLHVTTQAEGAPFLQTIFVC